ncbi:flagellar basal body rod protein FlgC [Moellerella wisconsensis]|uniref:Flagellar basal body rod protein FlgC n=2 Tax=Moellerella wisconsensis TaxID=158849 RepID=A0ACD3YB98_9GAMM|nr:flagellar basal body rod protein FlgC [Moellerella wisconsensis]KLN96281.1 flagellar basal body rod protein FlgC [Moellerella wisconsensis]UNH25659.1 flagellar basal body rod protein FlgC [Moellerella wisconsensis]UNH28796.1 flagellar basal body rod protein FlgC [Moellerella wisconsensis]UNH32257.1 flagellar basal body rod protein FlgC [Moellerella wisconsensis]UNH40423.1 flagellar basal body rod protein FlgC [Moellerella wisconsensis]
MALLSILDISSSALVAQSQRLNISASNMANADSVADMNGNPYQARQAVFQVKPDYQGHIGGVEVKQIIRDASPFRLEYQPGHPFADANGYLRKSNVDVAAEMINTISASRSYQANIEVMNTSKSLLQKTLTLGQ